MPPDLDKIYPTNRNIYMYISFDDLFLIHLVFKLHKQFISDLLFHFLFHSHKQCSHTSPNPKYLILMEKCHKIRNFLGNVILLTSIEQGP